MSVRPQLWLSAVDPYTASVSGNPGSADWMSLFGPENFWPTVSSETAAFKISTQYVMAASPNDLQTLFGWLNSHGIALAMEGLMLPYGAGGVGRNIEGFDDPGTMIVAANRIKEFGGNLSYVAMDEPLYYGSQYTGPGAPGYTIQQVAAGVAESVSQIRAVFPDTQFGDIEPVPATQDIMSWAAAFQATTGTPLAFFDADVGWNSDWQPALDSLQGDLTQAGISLGVIINGDSSASNGTEWESGALDRLQEIESDPNLSLQQIDVQTWDSVPTFIAPEDVPGTLTNVALQVLSQDQAIVPSDQAGGNPGISDQVSGVSDISSQALAQEPTTGSPGAGDTTGVGSANVGGALAPLSTVNPSSPEARQLYDVAYTNMFGEAPVGQTQYSIQKLLSLASVNVPADVSYLYCIIDGHLPSPQELNEYTTAMLQGAEFNWERASIATSAETESRIQGMVQSETGSAADAPVLNGVESWLESGLSLDQIAAVMGRISGVADRLQFLQASEPGAPLGTIFNVIYNGSLVCDALVQPKEISLMVSRGEDGIMEIEKQMAQGRSTHDIFLGQTLGGADLFVSYFHPDTDVICLPESIASNFGAVRSSISADSAGAVLNFGSHGTIDLPCSPSVLSPNNFSFFPG